jgi:hypothetical protein
MLDQSTRRFATCRWWWKLNELISKRIMFVHGDCILVLNEDACDRIAVESR